MGAPLRRTPLRASIAAMISARLPGGRAYSCRVISFSWRHSGARAQHPNPDSILLSCQPFLQIGGDERVVAQIRMYPAHTIDLLKLTRAQAFTAIEAPSALHQSLP